MTAMAQQSRSGRAATSLRRSTTPEERMLWLLTAASVVIVTCVAAFPDYVPLVTLLLPMLLGFALLVIWRHRENIQRLVAGTEPRVGVSRP